MRPSNAELLEGVIGELRRDVVPAATDPWLASRLRSVVALLTHLAARLDHGAAVLEASNAGLGAALDECAALVPSAVPPPAADLSDAEAHNLDLRQRAETLLRRLRDDRSAPAADARRILIAALQADAERERVLYEQFLRMATY